MMILFLSLNNELIVIIYIYHNNEPTGSSDNDAQL